MAKAQKTKPIGLVLKKGASSWSLRERNLIEDYDRRGHLTRSRRLGFNSQRVHLTQAANNSLGFLIEIDYN